MFENKELTLQMYIPQLHRDSWQYPKRFWHWGCLPIWKQTEIWSGVVGWVNLVYNRVAQSRDLNSIWGRFGLDLKFHLASASCRHAQINFDCELDLSSLGRDVLSDLKTISRAYPQGLMCLLSPAWMAPTEREILEPCLILAKADQKGKKKIPKATKGRPGKENTLYSEARSKKKLLQSSSFLFYLLCSIT